MWKLPDGTTITEMVPNSGEFVAWTVPCPDLAAFADVLRDVAGRPDHLISLSVYHGQPSEPFNIIPMSKLASLTGEPEDREKLKGFHDIDGVPTGARMKENVTPSSIVLLTETWRRAHLGSWRI